jgi:NAD+ synthase
MKAELVVEHIVSWLKDYATSAKSKGFVVGISGGIDSALTSILCAKTGLSTLAVSMPIRQHSSELTRAHDHQDFLRKNFINIQTAEIDLSSTLVSFQSSFPKNIKSHALTMANTRSRLRMTALYAFGQPNGLLVAGTGNKVEDFGIGFYTKYGDGGVDLSPIADLTKSQVFELAKHLDVIESIQTAQPTDGLWEEERTDEDQIGATYTELEWAMKFSGDAIRLSERQKEVLKIYKSYNRANKHKMIPIPVCTIPIKFFA